MKRLIAGGALAGALAMLAAGCSNLITTPSQESRSAAAQWIGKNRVDLANQMGQPKEAVPMTDTGGEMLFYSYEGHHYVFETGPDGSIISAVQTR
jgi:threonine dehydrogenase-like Zn-dependent dehydrogenase